MPNIMYVFNVHGYVLSFAYRKHYDFYFWKTGTRSEVFSMTNVRFPFFFSSGDTWSFFLYFVLILTVKEKLYNGNDQDADSFVFKRALCKFCTCTRASGHPFVVSEVAIFCGGFSIQFIANRFSASNAVHMCQDFFISSPVKKFWRFCKNIDFAHNAPPKHGSCIAIRPPFFIIEEVGHRGTYMISEIWTTALQSCSKIIPTTRRISRKFRRQLATQFFAILLLHITFVFFSCFQSMQIPRGRLGGASTSQSQLCKFLHAHVCGAFAQRCA